MYNDRTAETPREDTQRTIAPISARRSSYSDAYTRASATSGVYSRMSGTNSSSTARTYSSRASAARTSAGGSYAAQSTARGASSGKTGYPTRHDSYNSTRLAIQGTSARVLEPKTIEPKRRAKPEPAKKRPNTEWRGLRDYIRKTHALTKASIVIFVFMIAAAIAIIPIGSVSVTRAQNRLNSINSQIENVQREIESVNQDYLSSIDSVAAGLAAARIGMTINAQVTPIHP